MTVSITGGQMVTQVLASEGVRHVFCVPGESYLEVLDSLYEHPDIELISTRHESGAAFMAEAYAKASGQVGVCMATRAVGLSNLSIGLHTARQDSTPLVAIVGHVPQDHQEKEAFQEVPLAEWFRPVCKWTVEIRDVRRIPELLHRAFYVASTGRKGPVLVVMPQDVLEAVAETPTHPMAAYQASLPQPDLTMVKDVHQKLITAAQPLVIVGGGIGASGATAALLEAAKRYGLPIVSAFRRYDAVPNENPYFAGWLGFGPNRDLVEEIRQADLVLTIGTRLSQVTTQDYTLLSPETKLIVIDVDPFAGVTAHPPAAVISSDAAAFCNSLLAVGEDFGGLSAVDRSKRLERIDRLHRSYLQFSEPRQVQGDGAVNLEGMMYDFVRTVPRDAVITSDAGNFFGWLARYYRFNEPGTYVGPTSGAMGYGLPAALGAKLAKPSATVVAFAGDGGFMMTMSEMATAALYEIPVVAIVVNNSLYGTIRAHQERKHKGRPVGTSLVNPSFAEVARSFGGFGARVTTNEEFKKALLQALSAGRFAVVEVMSNPEILSAGS